jgi:hypothetical protein
MFLGRGGPIPVEEVVGAFRDSPLYTIHDALVALDDDDLIRVREGRVDVAYPFSASPTPFVVRLPGGKERYACCAIDALGIAPMLGQPIRVRSECHHCRMPLEVSARPEGARTGRGGGHGLDREAGRGPAADRDLALNGAQLLPVGRAPEAWRETNPEAAGAGATVGEAFKLARRIFGGLLDGA